MQTENTKHLLRYLTVVRSQHNYSSKREQAQRIEDHILSFSPMLESFGMDALFSSLIWGV